MSQSVLVERADDIATVILNAPEKLNALSKGTWERLADVMAGLSAEDDLRCIVVRGAGDRAFAAGADISEFETERSDPESCKAYSRMVARTMNTVAECRHPTIALIKGACVGGGLEIACCCDLRICGDSSRFGIPVNRLGLVMAHAELTMLLALVGRAQTLEILLEGRVFGAAEAKEKGLVNRVVPDADVEDEVYATARRIAAGAPLVARWHKRFARRLLDPRPLTEKEVDEGVACFETEDYRIGIRAFLDKKTPLFKGR
ncbi:MAG: enoyl-CoA hydratase/isomerase family protein [Proteobacteria bacterium]|nr:enoyl-CoA hydratase/isomerase family protein [Pseudomonadota bacterium]